MKKVIKIFLFGFMLISVFSCAQASGGDDNNTVADSGVSGKVDKQYPYGIYYCTPNSTKLYYTLIKGGYNASKKSDNGINYSSWVGDCKFDDNFAYITLYGNSSNVGKYAYSTSASGDTLYLTGYPKEGGQICEIYDISPDYDEAGQVLTLHKYTETGSTGSDTGDNGGGSSVSASDLNGTWNYNSKTVTFNNGTITRSDVSSSFSYTLSGNKLTVENNAEYTISISDNKLKIDAGNDTQNKQLLKTFFGYTGSDSYMELTK